jgi:hypothetical protein
VQYPNEMLQTEKMRLWEDAETRGRVEDGKEVCEVRITIKIKRSRSSKGCDGSGYGYC